MRTNGMKGYSKRVAAAAAALVFSLAVGLTGCGETEVDTSPVTEGEIAALYTSPDDFKGRTYEFTGRVLDVEKDGDTLCLQVYQNIKDYDNNTVVVYENGDVEVKDEDFVKVTGTIEGEFSGSNAFGGEVMAPQVNAEQVEKIDAMEAFPALRTVEVDQSVKKGKIKATVEKVDFTADETRIYLKVKNKGSSTFDNYPDQGVILQDGKQYEAEWNEYYPEPATELRGGVTSESVITFKKIDEADFTYSFSGYDEEYNDYEFTFDIGVE